MKTLSIGKLRGLQQCTTPRGTFTCLALDHRQNLRKANPVFVSDAELSRFKLDVTRLLASKATAVLLDPEVSAAQAIAERAIPGGIGLVVAIESTGYTGDVTARHAPHPSDLPLPCPRQTLDGFLQRRCALRLV